MPTRQPANYHHLSSAILVLSCLLLIMQSIDYINFTVDDVFIPLRIAQNVADGFGFVYNKGDFIEGHSDPLWVAILAIVSAIGVGNESPYDLLWVAKGLSYLFGVLSILFTYNLLKKMLHSSPAKDLYAALGALSLIICSPFILWSCSGLEMTMTAFLYLVATFAAYRILYSENGAPTTSFLVVGLTFILASLTRPEAPLFAVAGFTYLFFASKQRMKLVILAIVPYVLVCGAFLLWRYNTYGDLLPSAFYAKTSNGPRAFVLGAKYFLGSLGGICGPLIVAIPFAFSRKEPLAKIRAFMLVLLAATMVFTVYSSGDWMPAFRFLVLVAPLLCILGILSIRVIVVKLTSERSVFCSSLSLFASIALVATTNVFVMRDLIRGNDETLATGFTIIRGHSEAHHEAVALWLQDRLYKNATVATGEAGLIGYLNHDMQLLDLNGLMDRKIAFDRKAGLPFNAEYIMERRPEYIILYGLNAIDQQARLLPPWSNYSDHILRHPRFKELYERKAQFVSFDIYQKK